MRPPEELNFFDGFNISLHGITPEMVSGQPGFCERLSQLLDLASGLPLVAHNASFDMGAVREGCTFEGRPWPRVDYACSLLMARRALDLISYRLPLVAKECGVELAAQHEPCADAVACAGIAIEIARRRGATTLDDLLTDLHMLKGRLDPQVWHGCRGKWGYAPPPEAALGADPEHPLYGQVIVFTGALSIRRQDAWAAVAALRGQSGEGRDEADDATRRRRRVHRRRPSRLLHRQGREGSAMAGQRARHRGTHGSGPRRHAQGNAHLRSARGGACPALPRRRLQA
jgi:Exonuclease